jgi:membrane protease YdiL (CAAX protease family)
MEDQKLDLKIADKKIEVVPWRPVLGVLFVISIYYFSQIFGGIVVSIYPWAKHWSNDRASSWLNSSTYAQFIYVVLAEAFTIGAIYLFLKNYHKTFGLIGLIKPRLKDVGYGLLAVPLYYLLYILTVGIVSYFVPSLNINQHQEVGFSNVHGIIQLSLTFMSLVILPPLAEEIMVRGFLYSSLRKGLPQLAAVIMTSLIFASAHLPEGGSSGPLYIAALDTFVLSLVLIYLRQRTGGLWAGITLHGFKNAVAFLSIFVLSVH